MMTTAEGNVDTLADRLTAKVTVIESTNLPTVIRFHRAEYYVMLSVNGERKKTQTKKKPEWNQTFYFDTQGSAVLELKLYRHGYTSEQFIGRIMQELSVFLNAGPDHQEITKNLDECHSTTFKPSITFRVEFDQRPPQAVELDDAVSKAVLAGDRMQLAHPELDAASSVTAVLSPVEQLPPIDTLGPLIEHMKVFVDAMDLFVEIHPYAKAAWTVLSSVYKVIASQMERDNKVHNLCGTMKDVYDLVTTKYLKDVESLKDALARLSKQTLECSYFIQDYVNYTFVQRVGKNLYSNMDNIIKQHQQQFKDLQNDLITRAVINSTINVMRVLNKTDSVIEAIDLNDLPYAGGMRFDPGRCCLPSTRTEILERIFDWANDLSTQQRRILLLTGLTGSGKSAIAHTIAQRFSELRRLGSSFFCSRSKPQNSRPEMVFCTIAADLANLEPKFKARLWNVIKDDRSLRKTESPQEQFASFICEPMKGLTTVGPLLIVIDALDELECGDKDLKDQMKKLVRILSEKVSDLPANIRILLTARDGETNIENAFYDNPLVRHMSMSDITQTSTDVDIKAFILNELSAIPPAQKDWPSDESCAERLVEKARGLFIFASTACQFIIGRGQVDASPSERLEKILSSTSTNILDGLYLEVLKYAVSETGMNQFKLMMGLIVTAEIPLSLNTLNDLCWREGGKKLAPALVQPLGALLLGTTDPDTPLQPLHASFAEFIIDLERSDKFHVNVKEAHAIFASSCLHVMNNNLKHDLCNIGDIFIQYEDIEDYPGLMQKIPAELQYACQFWNSHLYEVDTNVDSLLQQIETFLFNHLLHWIESLSLMQQLEGGVMMLHSLKQWLKHFAPGRSDLLTMTHDGVRFIGAFFTPISYGPLHVYVSALPFTPINTLLYKTYFSPDPSLPIIVAGQQLEWPMEINLVGHREGVTHVAFSSNGKWIASGSVDGTIRLWDVEMGCTVSEGREDEWCRVTSLAFSLDATQLATAWSNGIVWLWKSGDTDNSDFLFDKSLQIQDTSDSNSVCSLAIAFSPDGKQLATGSCPDGILQLWDTEAGRLSDGQPEVAKSDSDDAHTIISLSFAPYKPWLLSATNKILQLWDMGTGASISDPLKEYECVINSILFSPNGAWFASCTDLDTLLWDTETTSPVHKLVHHITIPHNIEHLHSIFSFSPDSASFIMAEYFVTHKIQRWNVQTGVPVGTVPFPRTELHVSTVALSSDCTRVIIGSHNGTVQLWDLDSTGDGASEHTNESFPLAAFSPSDMQVATSSVDGAVLHLWDVVSGIARPIKRHEDVKRLQYSPDGTRLVNLSACRLELFSTETGDPVGDPLEIILHKAIVIFSPNGRWLAISAGNGLIQVLDFQTGALVATLADRIDSVTKLSFSADGTRLATMQNIGIVQLWNPETGVALVGPPMDDWKFSETSVNGNKMPGCDKPFIALSSKGTYVARLPRFQLWNVELAAEVEMKTDIHTRAVSIAFSPDESLLLIVAWEKEADNVPGYHCFARFWNTVTGTPIGERLTLGDPNDMWYKCTFVFFPDGLRVAGGTPLATHLWDVQTGSPIGGRSDLSGDATILTSTLIQNPVLFSGILNQSNKADRTGRCSSITCPAHAGNSCEYIVDYPSGWRDNDGWVCSPTRLLWFVPEHYRTDGNRYMDGDLNSLVLGDQSTGTVVLFRKVEQHLRV